MSARRGVYVDRVSVPRMLYTLTSLEVPPSLVAASRGRARVGRRRGLGLGPRSALGARGLGRSARGARSGGGRGGVLVRDSIL